MYSMCRATSSVPGTKYFPHPPIAPTDGVLEAQGPPSMVLTVWKIQLLTGKNIFPAVEVLDWVLGAESIAGGTEWKSIHQFQGPSEGGLHPLSYISSPTFAVSFWRICLCKTYHRENLPTLLLWNSPCWVCQRLSIHWDRKRDAISNSK